MTDRKNFKSAGFTLIEIAVSLIVLGLVITPFLAYLNNQTKQKEIEVTFARVQGVADLLQSHRDLTGAYPCPAPLTGVARNTPAYGRAAGNCATAVVGDIGTCPAGVCIEGALGARIAQRDAELGTPGAFDPVVVVGALPFRDMQIEEKDTLDAYGNKLLYAVTRSLTDPLTFNELNGAIQIVNEAGEDLTVDPGSAAYTIVAPGKNDIGGFSDQGVAQVDCGAAAAQERENCNPGFSGGAPEAIARYRVAVKNRVDGGANEFDDEVMYFSQNSAAYWRRTTAGFQDIEDLSPDGVGVGVTSPDTNVNVEISSSGTTDSLRAFRDVAANVGGKIIADEVCLDDGTNCFDTTLLTGVGATDDGTTPLTCPADQYMVGIGNNGPLCEPFVTLGCDPQSAEPVFLGANPDGSARCGPLPNFSCLATTVQVCGETVQLPSGFEESFYPASSSPAVGADGVAGNFPSRFGSGPYLGRVHTGYCCATQFKCDNGNWRVEGSVAGQQSEFVVNPNAECADFNARRFHVGGATPFNRCGYIGNYEQENECSDWGEVTNVRNNAELVCLPCDGGNCTIFPFCNDVLNSTLYGENDRVIRTITVAADARGACVPTNDPPSDNTDECRCASGFADGEIMTSSVECPTLPGVFQTVSQRFDAATCSFVTERTEGDCACEPDETREVDAICDPTNVCLEPDPSDRRIEFVTQDPNAGCAETISVQSEGSCKPKEFTWRNSSGPLGAGFYSNGLNETCFCSDHLATINAGDTEICGTGNNSTGETYECKCR